MAIKPILFNTEMVRAILDGRKSCTRRLVKHQPDEKHTYPLGFVNDSTEKRDIGCFGFGIDEYGGSVQYAKPPYQLGDILYVRETFAWCPCWDCGLNVEEPGCEYEQEKKYNNKKKEHGCYVYRASCEDNEYPSADTWHPSIHMPKEATRIWLKVKDVRVERLQEITEDGCIAEGIYPSNCRGCNATFGCDTCPHEGYDEVDEFVDLWNSTIKKSDLDRYGWDVNPWVWVVEFERCEKPEGV